MICSKFPSHNFVFSSNPDMDSGVLSAALHVASNVATGMPVHQEAVMISGIPQQLPKSVYTLEAKLYGLCVTQK